MLRILFRPVKKLLQQSLLQELINIYTLRTIQVEEEEYQEDEEKTEHATNPSSFNLS